MGTDTVSDRIYPPAAFDDARRQSREAALRDTGFAQPAIGAVSLGLLRILEEFGVRPDLVGGHSFGELTALCAAGRIDDASLAILAHRRGAIMARCASRRVRGDARRLRPDRRGLGPGPHACPGSGRRQQECPPAMRALGFGRGDRAEPPDPGRSTDHNPTRPGLGGVSQPVRRGGRGSVPGRSRDGELSGLRRSPFSPTRRPSPIPTIRSRCATCSPASSRGPSSSSRRSRRCIGRGARTFLEVGPDAKLTGLVRAILDGRDHLAIAVDASRGSAGNVHDLACSLATLAALGYAVDLNHWDEGESARVRAGDETGADRADLRRQRPSEGPTDRGAREETGTGPAAGTGASQAAGGRSADSAILPLGGHGPDDA